ncbi:hypothetical protein TPAU25S_04119 [Tsukamurella paurometabola]|nr:Uncharacterised protein [Tsukamurella paurometabola]
MTSPLRWRDGDTSVVSWYMARILALDTTIPAYDYVKDRLDRQAIHATITRALDGTTDDPKGAAWS